MNLQNVSKEVVTVGLLVLSLVVLEWLWLDWQFSRKLNRLENQVENLPHNEQVTKEQVEAWIKHITRRIIWENGKCISV